MLERWRRARRVLAESQEQFEDPTPRRSPSWAQDLLLAVLDPRTGRLDLDGSFRTVVTGALLLELVHDGRLGVGGAGRRTTLEVLDRSPLGVPELDDALLAVAASPLGGRVTRLLPFLPGSSDIVLRLVRDGLLVERRHRWLGLVPVRRYEAMPALRHEDVLDRGRWALLGQGEPDARSVRLAVLLDTGAKTRRVVPRNQREAAWRRAEELRERLGDQEQLLLLRSVKAAWSRANDG